MLENKIQELTEAIKGLTDLIQAINAVTPVTNKTEPKTAQKPKKVSEVKEDEKTLELTLNDITEETHKAIAQFDRDIVKSIIKKYADKLVEIDPSKFADYIADLKAL